MNIKSLRMIGFKSFGIDTEISFHDGVNAIVGPNGCGKSNIGDALRWIMGEQNVRHLRGDRIEDIIFSGSRDMKPTGMAEVSMLIEAGPGGLPVQVQGLLRTGGHPPGLPERRERVLHQQETLSPQGCPRDLHGHGFESPGLLDHRAGVHPGHRQLLPPGVAAADRRSRRDHQVPRTQGGHDPEDGGHQGEPRPSPGHHRRGRAAGPGGHPPGLRGAALPGLPEGTPADGGLPALPRLS